MADLKKISILISTLLMVLQLHNSPSKAAIKGGYCSVLSLYTNRPGKELFSEENPLSIGGGGGPTLTAKFAKMASQANPRKSFIDSSIQQARRNNFHGLDLGGEYPSSDTDKTNFASLIREWKAAVAKESSTTGKPPLLLFAVVGGFDQITPLQYDTI
ncbi:endochitinase protein [Spatholobus suberectus]|nr:endochitinase protein [Spatholobus suberectus]